MPPDDRHQENVTIFAVDKEDGARHPFAHEAGLLIERDRRRVVDANA